MAVEWIVVLGLLVAHGRADQLGPGNHTRYVRQGELRRAYHVHVPPAYDARRPMPVVLALHGAAMNGQIMEWVSGLSKKADQAGFIAVYPNGTGPGGTLLTWNAGIFPGSLNPRRADDVGYIGRVLDDLGTAVRYDHKRVYVTGMSNGAMMAYRLAVEMPERIAAIAPVAGVMCLPDPMPRRPVPILHIHGTKDGLVPFEGVKNGSPFKFPSVEECVHCWCKVNGCALTPTETELPTNHDSLRVVRKDYSTGNAKAPVVLYVVEGGGHTWPGLDRHARFLGANTHNIVADDLMWDFFRQFSLK